MQQRSNAELLEITTIFRNDYQPDALSAAEHELKSRNLTGQELADTRAELAIKRQEEEQKKEQIKAFQDKATDILDTFNPLTENTTDQIIKTIAIGLAIPYLIHFFNNLDLTLLILQDFENWDIGVLGYFAPLILYPIGFTGFWSVRKYGWIITTIMLTYLMGTTLFAAAWEIHWSMREPLAFDTGGSLSIQLNDKSPLDLLFDHKGFSFHMVQALVIGAVLFYINTPRITTKFQLPKLTQVLAIGMTATAITLLWLTLLV